MKIGIIGCGNMGQALLRGIIRQRYADKRNICCSDIDVKKLASVRLRFGVRIANSNSRLIKNSDVVIFAIKPEDLDTVIAQVNSALKGKLLISICAGITIKRLERHLGKVSIVRVMPNMPAQVSQGISAISLGKYVKLKDRKKAIAIFSCIGEVVEIRERLMDAVTAISGSGPAYFFYLAERLIDSAKEMGIPGRIAQRLAIKTALGSAMLMDESKESLQMLRQRISSKGGTTEAALNVFKKKALEKLLHQAFRAAAKRARELR